ncbi:MAG: lipopolysaccharide assembly protein LapB [Neisseriaceae bacterium]|nr:lipopolysaccharide assembly protein [Pseudomonadota bacterium]RTL01381.1 MAG: lipopolysaccharide assembly protein LapB [Neisseriaceae bacterium]
MEFDFWWLLVPPLFFAFGWLAARIDIKQLINESKRLPSAYYKGLNFLLNDQEDQAIDVFVEIIKLNPDSVELNFALGSMFRRKGEIDRAILIHQKLLQRNDIAAELRLDAQYELALDYLKSGLLDRAEDGLKALQGGRYARKASGHLLDIYQQEKQWEKAIAVANTLSDANYSFQHEVAQFYCELALRDIANSQPDAARSHLEQALATHRKCARANIMLGEIDAAAGHYESAIVIWQRIEGQDPQYLSLVGTKILDAFRRLERPADGVQLLKSYLSTYPTLDLLDLIHQAVLEQEGEQVALEYVYSVLRANPSMLGLKTLADAESLLAPVERRKDLEVIRSLINENTRKLSMYHCTACGFRAKQYYWHCPGCSGWETYNPKLGAESV